MKKCSVCNKSKELTEFSITNTKTGRRRPECKRCFADKWNSKYRYSSARDREKNEIRSAIKGLRAIISNAEKSIDKLELIEAKFFGGK